MLTEVLISVFRISAGMFSVPVALLFFGDLIASPTLVSVWGSQFISPGWMVVVLEDWLAEAY